MNAQSKITRISRSGIPRATSARILSDPKARMSGRQRRQLMRSRNLEVVVHDLTGLDVGAEPVHPAVKMATKLSKLTLHRLNRRVHQFARRASTARHIALKLPPDGSLRRVMEQQQNIQLGFFKQASAEISARMLAVQGKLAE